MKYVVYAVRASVFGLFGISLIRPENLGTLIASVAILAGYEFLYAYSLRHPTIDLDTQALIEKVENMERDFAETKNKISALSMAAGIKPQVAKNPFARS